MSSSSSTAQSTATGGSIGSDSGSVNWTLIIIAGLVIGAFLYLRKRK